MCTSKMLVLLILCALGESHDGAFPSFSPLSFFPVQCAEEVKWSKIYYFGGVMVLAFSWHNRFS
uniref:Uncharacterized protein n=1 Tax=Rhizophora mucronata TaxID=61149 RepID=A0A2P2LL03_RHIMU